MIDDEEHDRELDDLDEELQEGDEYDDHESSHLFQAVGKGVLAQFFCPKRRRRIMKKDKTNIFGTEAGAIPIFITSIETSDRYIGKRMGDQLNVISGRIHGYPSRVRVGRGRI